MEGKWCRQGGCAKSPEPPRRPVEYPPRIGTHSTENGRKPPATRYHKPAPLQRQVCCQIHLITLARLSCDPASEDQTCQMRTVLPRSIGLDQARYCPDPDRQGAPTQNRHLEKGLKLRPCDIGTTHSKACKATGSVRFEMSRRQRRLTIVVRCETVGIRYPLAAPC